MEPSRWEHFSHDADIGVRGIGATKAQAFEQAALALTAVITDPAKLDGRDLVEIDCQSPDDEFLLVDWLNALIYEMATRQLLFSRFELQFNDLRLHARAWGEPVNVAAHQPAVEVKGATLTSLRVEHQADGTWLAQCIVDV